MADKFFEIDIVARDAQNPTATKPVEYKAVNAETPEQAVEEFYRGLTTHSQARTREIQPEGKREV